MKTKTKHQKTASPQDRKRWSERVWGAMPPIFLVAVVAVIVILFQHIQTEQKRVAAEKSAALGQERSEANVVTLDIVPAPIRDRINLPGVTAPWTKLMILTEMKGKVLKKSVQEGDSIKKGDIIARLDSREYKNTFLSLKASYNTARASLRRIKKLYKSGSATQAQLDEVLAKAENLKAAMNNAALDLERCVIRSPLTGVINRLFIEEGQYLNAAQRVAEVLQIDRIKVEVGIPESDVDAVRRVNDFDVKIDALGGKIFRAKKYFLSKTAESTARLYNLILIIQNLREEILPDMFVRVEIVKKEILNGISVPIYAVINRSDQHIVYIVNGKHVHARKVELGLLDGWRVQVKSGLKKGDQVIVVGQRNVNTGEEVKVIRTIRDVRDIIK